MLATNNNQPVLITVGVDEKMVQLTILLDDQKQETTQLKCEIQEKNLQAEQWSKQREEMRQQITRLETQNGEQEKQVNNLKDQMADMRVQTMQIRNDHLQNIAGSLLHKVNTNLYLELSVH